MLELRHQMTKMDQLPAMDKDKVHDDYHSYERLVKDSRHDIQKHLNVIRQKEADQTGGARAKVPASEFEPKRKEHHGGDEQQRRRRDAAGGRAETSGAGAAATPAAAFGRRSRS